MASIGSSFWVVSLSKVRYSPTCASMFSPPASETVSGFIDATGVCCATRIVPPFLPVPVGAAPDGPELDLPALLAPPQAASTAPTAVADSPATEARLTN